MSLAYRLFGNTTLAASYRREAQRILSFLRDRLALGKIDSGKMSRTYPDGTAITVSAVFGNEIIAIQSPFFEEEERLLTWDLLFIMVYWEAETKKFYQLKRSMDNGRVIDIQVRELDHSIPVDILSTYSQNAPLILNDFLRDPKGPDHHVVNRGVSRDAWLDARSSGALDYRARFRCRRIVGGADLGAVNYPYRQVTKFGGNYGAESAYFPKRDGESIAWEEVFHSSYGEGTDVRGPANFTLARDDHGNPYASSWGQRIVEDGYGPESAVSNVNGVVQSGFLNIFGPDYTYEQVGVYIWPVITSANVRKRPLRYSLRSETDDGTTETPGIFEDSLSYSHSQIMWYGVEAGGVTATTCRALSHTPVACFGRKRPLFFRNTLAYDLEYESHARYLPVSEPGEYAGSSAETEVETLDQELVLGSEVLASGRSVFNVTTQGSSLSVYAYLPSPPYPPTSLYRASWESFWEKIVSARYVSWDVLAFSEFEEQFILFLKKTTVDLSLAYSNRESGANPSEYVHTLTVHQEAAKTVEYFLRADRGVSRLLATFHQTMAYDHELVMGKDPLYLNEFVRSVSWSGAQNGSGQRIHGVSCQANPRGPAVFSYTLETYAGAESPSDYLFYIPLQTAFSYGPFNHWQGVTIPEYYPLAAYKALYPFPLEDQSTRLDGSQAWNNQSLVVGAISQGVAGLGYFDFVSAPGSVGIVKRHIEEGI